MICPGCSKSVVMYNASWCPYCWQVRAILARNNIKYSILDATTRAFIFGVSRAAAHLPPEEGFRRVPLQQESRFLRRDISPVDAFSKTPGANEPCP
jgi:hypothetical protein